MQQVYVTSKGKYDMWRTDAGSYTIYRVFSYKPRKDHLMKKNMHLVQALEDLTTLAESVGEDVVRVSKSDILEESIPESFPEGDTINLDILKRLISKEEERAFGPFKKSEISPRTGLPYY